MELHLIYPANLRCFSAIHNRTRKLLVIKSSKKDSTTTSKGLQKSSQKELSRILRTEAAIKNIEKKANSNKYNNLNPKAVLEALDDAMKRNQWESALKVCRFSFSWFYFPSFNSLFFSESYMLWLERLDKEVIFLIKILFLYNKFDDGFVCWLLE